MLRRVLEEFGLFLIPFVLFLGYLVLAGRNPLRRGALGPASPPARPGRLAVVIGTLVYEGLFSERRRRRLRADPYGERPAGAGRLPLRRDLDRGGPAALLGAAGRTPRARSPRSARRRDPPGRRLRARRAPRNARRRYRPRDDAAAGRGDGPRRPDARPQGGSDRDRARHGHPGHRGRPDRGHDPARGCRDRRPPRGRPVRPRLRAGRRAAGLHRQRALARIATARLHDTVGGLADLEAGRVRFIGDPATRIREDALRILRFFRFHARFGIGRARRSGPRRLRRPRGTASTGLSRERVRIRIPEAAGRRGRSRDGARS